MAISSEDKQKVKSLVILGKKQGYLTQDDILAVFPEIEDNLQLLEYIIASIQDDEIEIIEPREDDGSEFEGKKGKMTFEEKIKILKQIKSHVSTDPIRAYLQEIGRIPLLSAEEEVILAQRFEKGTEEMHALIEKFAKENKHPAYVKAWERIKKEEDRHIEVEKAKQRIVEKDRRFTTKVIREGVEAKHLLTTANLRLVVSIAKNYLKRGLDLLDLIQEGNLGLMKAVEKFEYRKGFKFSTYATWWIRQAITRAIADQARTIRVPVHMIETINKLSKVSSQLASKLGRKPTLKEIAKAMDLTPKKVQEIIKIAQKPQSLETPIGEDGENSLIDIIPDEYTASPQELATFSFLKKQINEILDGLSDRERKVIELRFGLRDGVTRTLEEVGHEFNVTRERIRQIEAKALKRMKSEEVAQALKDYLD
ncbi:RNA polymerase sigma factor RpoD [Candidatus Dojkabacteria bacterium]|uniref:RNA polymerase sigma factor SigA n=1 Tax=Candidatus Dojkabacteria bacterium TaxID=2099670 RepID=A0A955L9A6_9BACT|nr:RNA polymerase sigma factor RpoD [Candidatus Dojkabacteria bacterium]